MEYTYFLVQICPDSHKYFRRVCQFRVLPFDLSTVPTGVPNTRTGGLQTKCRQVGTGSSTGHSGSRSRTSSGSGESCSSRFHGSGDIYPTLHVVLQVSAFMGPLIWASCLAPLGPLHLRLLQGYSNSMGLANWFALVLVTPVGPTPTASTMVGPLFWNPYPYLAFPSRDNHLYGCLHPGEGTHIGDSQT